MENHNVMETSEIILDLLQKLEKSTSSGDVTKAILAYRVIRDLSPNFNQDITFALRLGGKAEEMFWSVDDSRFTPDDVIDALCYTESTQLRLPEISDLPMEQFATVAIRACVEYRAHMEHGDFPDDGVSLQELLEHI